VPERNSVKLAMKFTKTIISKRTRNPFAHIKSMVKIQNANSLTELNLVILIMEIKLIEQIILN